MISVLYLLWFKFGGKSKKGGNAKLWQLTNIKQDLPKTNTVNSILTVFNQLCHVWADGSISGMFLGIQKLGDTTGIR